MAQYKLIAQSAIIVALLTLSLIISLPVEGPEPLQGSEWHIETVDHANAGLWNSLALDSMDSPRIAYYDDGARSLKYARWNGTVWNIETVDSGEDIGRYASLALDKGDNPHIAYFDSTNYKLMYAKWTGSTWEIEIADPAGWSGYATSLALDSSDTPHISYGHKTSHDLMYATPTGLGWWRTEYLDQSGWMNPFTSIAVDSKDNPHISYHMLTDNHILKYAVWDGATWNIEVADETGSNGWYNSLALDSKDVPHISHYDHYNQTLRYATWNGTAWIHEVVDSAGNVGQCTSIAVDGKDNPHIAYHDDDNESLKYAAWNGTAWNVEVVDTFGWAGCRNSIAIDSNDVPHISYHDYINGNLKYAKKVEATPPSEPIITDAILSGSGLEDVTIFWDKSADDGAGRDNVIRYDIYESTSYAGVYSLVAGVPADGSLVYGWTCLGCGEGDPNDRFFYVEANDSVHSTPSPNKAGKFTRPLAQGPNLVSIPLIQSNESIETVLQTVNYDRAWYYDSSSQEWKWHMTYKEYRRGLWSVNHTMGIWVNVTENSNLTVAGVVPAQTTIHLIQGWNLVSFPSVNATYTVADLKTETGATRVEGYDLTPPYFLRVMSDAEALQVGYGYWVKVEAEVVWTVSIV